MKQLNILKKAAQDIIFSIPNEVLVRAFQDNIGWRSAPISLEELILIKVIRPKVLIDANIVGGDNMIISLEGINPTYIDNYTTIYNVPLEKTNYRTIISVLSLSYLPNMIHNNPMGVGLGTVDINSVNDISMTGQRLLSSYANLPVISTANAEIVGTNSILIRNEIRASSGYLLKCVIANEENLNNISIRSSVQFSKLCELAVKAFIYNKLIIKIDMAALEAGQELGAIKTYVESLSDAKENYDTYLKEVWTKVAFMNDKPNFTRHVRSMVNPGL